MALINRKITVDLTDSVYNAASQAFREYVAKIGDQFQDEIESVQWTWTPVRHNKAKKWHPCNQSPRHCRHWPITRFTTTTCY